MEIKGMDLPIYLPKRCDRCIHYKKLRVSKPGIKNPCGLHGGYWLAENWCCDWKGVNDGN